MLARQVFDIPPVELLVTEHQVTVKCCPECGQTSQGHFPFEASNVVQYGSRLKGMMVYLMEQQLLPSHRTCETLSDLLGVEVSEGTLYNTRAQCSELIAPIDKGIEQLVQAAEVVHFDETGLRVESETVVAACGHNQRANLLFRSSKRGRLAMDEMGILPEFKGKAVHDGLQSYQGYDCEHFLCNAHHLRELQYILEHYNQWWAFHLSVLLVSIHSQVKALNSRKNRLCPHRTKPP